MFPDAETEPDFFFFFSFFFSRGNQEGLYISKLSFSFGEGGLFILG